MSISITPKNSTTISTQTMSIDELLDERLKERQSKAERMIEELRPLCEELPLDALDPVSMEPFNGKNIPIVYRCGHVFNKSTVKKMIDLSDPARLGDLDCPVCKLVCGRVQLLDCIPLEGLVDHMEKITKVFKENTENEPT